MNRSINRLWCRGHITNSGVHYFSNSVTNPLCGLPSDCQKRSPLHHIDSYKGVGAHACLGCATGNPLAIDVRHHHHIVHSDDDMRVRQEQKKVNESQMNRSQLQDGYVPGEVLPDLTPQATMSPRSLRHRPTDTRQPSLKWAEHNWMLSTRAGARWAYIQVESRQTSKKMVCWTGASTLFWPFNQRASA